MIGQKSTAERLVRRRRDVEWESGSHLSAVRLSQRRMGGLVETDEEPQAVLRSASILSALPWCTRGERLLWKQPVSVKTARAVFGW
ncbi:unnamed protein product [Heligmosomoides polygyrus]|uniref:Uncharacterized protein n=1 Tax=Heligmosomoides polygyrus TaxID=6339 RepID=A0A183F4A4_HELPZ|nr:unnamed protein product [Heligmosomoides polygyrus]